MGQDAPPPLIRQHSRESHHKTSGKYIHTKKEKQEKPVFLFLFAFPALPSMLKKLKEKTATEMDREKK
jgi:hypothetical protein